MDAKIAKAALAAAVLAGVAAVAASGAGEGAEGRASKTSEAAVVTNDNGSVSRTYSESSVSTNGNMVTERRRETRTTLDTGGNILETSTSEYAQSWTVGDTPPASCGRGCAAGEDGRDAADSFLGLKFGAVHEAEKYEEDPCEPALRRVTFKPAKPLEGFDDYFVYVTPKTHKVAKICACAKEAVEPGARWRRHYLVEALEKKYSTWARLCSFTRPVYAFDIGSGRYVTACLSGASRDYGTVLAAWDDALLTLAADETEELRREARAAARDKRQKRVEAAAEAF